MIECPANHPSLAGLINPQIPNNPALWAVFKGKHAGQAVVDNLEKPSQCLVHTGALLTYPSRSISKDFLANAIRYFQQSRQVWLVRSAGDPQAPDGYKLMPRIEFYGYDRYSTVLAGLRQHIGAGFQIRLIDQELIKRCEWREDMEFYCGSVENFLNNELGMCLMHQDEIIVEAYASALGEKYAEVGAITHEPYRGHGYAPIAVAYLIEVLEQKGYHAYWSCDTDNLASRQVAHKLGFKIENPYEIWEYPQESA